MEPSNLLKLHLELAHKLSLVRVVPVAPVAMLVLGLLLEKLLETFVVEVLVFGRLGRGEVRVGAIGGMGGKERRCCGLEDGSRDRRLWKLEALAEPTGSTSAFQSIKRACP